MFWVLVPVFWVPVHAFPRVFKKLGLLTYVVPLFTWLPLAYIIYLNSDFLLRNEVSLPLVLNLTGVVIFIAGVLLQLWTASLLSFFRLIGLPEITADEKKHFVVEGPYSVLRHPTYLSHTLMFLGVFLITEVTAVGIITLLDIIMINTLVIPLEDRELINRFGEEYAEYKKKVPQFFPNIFRRSG